MSVLALTDAKRHLNISSDQHDYELQDFIDSAERTLAHWVGPLEPTPVTQQVTVPDGRGTAYLSVTPVVSLTSVTRGGTTVDVTSLLADAGEGIVTLSPGAYTVGYVAGHDPLPADLLQAVKELLRHLWTTQRGSGVRPGQGQTEQQQPGAGYLLPYRVQELISPYVDVVLA